MTCAEIVRGHLLTLTPVTAIVNSRIWTFRWPTNGPSTLPAVLVQQISDVQEQLLRGTLGLQEARIQLDLIGETVAACRALDQAIVGDYSMGNVTGLRGAVATVGSSHIRNAMPIGYREFFEPDEKQRPRIVRDFRVWYEA